MCGRYTLRTSALELQDFFRTLDVIDHQPRFNIAPSQSCPIIRADDDGRHLDLLRWGFIPAWAKDEKIGYKMINARSEEIARSYKPALKRRRCLVATDGWYEWQNKQPYHFRLPQGKIFAFAGIWERWHDLESFSIFTTQSTGLAAEYHDRMPVILPEDAYDVWLDPRVDGHELRETLLVPWAGALDVVAANTCVGNARNESADCLPD